MNTRINLNLLLALDALLLEKNVTRAAARMFITQSAMSNALKQLRSHFQDELLIRGAGGMILTSKAQTLQPQLHKLINELKQLTAIEPTFDPSISERIFHIGMSDIAELILLPAILTKLKAIAPKIRLEIHPVNHIRCLDDFSQPQIELVCGCLVDEITNVEQEPCFTFSGVVIADKTHPLIQKKITLQAYLSARHLRVKYVTDTISTNIDNILEKMGEKRNIVATLPHVMATLFMLQGTDLLASIPACITDELANALNLRMQALPFKNLFTCPTFNAWPRQHDKDPGLVWLRQIINETSNKLNVISKKNL